MKYQLLTEHQIIFPTDYEVTNDNFVINGPLRYKYVTMPATMIEVERNPNNSEECLQLQTFITDQIQNGNRQRNEEFWMLDLYIGIQPEDYERQDDMLKGYVKLDGKLLQFLREMCGEMGTPTIQVELEFLREGQLWGLPPCRIFTQKMAVVGSTCTDYTLQFPVSHFWNWDCESFHCVCTITAKIPNDLASKRVANEAPKKISIPQKMLEEEILSDVVLVAGNGAKVKAHKSFLAVHSSVFLAMFQSDMEEARESTVEIPDMAEGSVRALLKYLYYEDIEPNDSLIAFELFCAGHKYDISELEKLMRELLLKKGNDWFEMGVAVKIFLFARKLTPVDDEMTKKAIQVLKLHLDTLEESPTYQEIFEKDTKVAMEICKYAFAT